MMVTLCHVPIVLSQLQVRQWSRTVAPMVVQGDRLPSHRGWTGGRLSVLLASQSSGVGRAYWTDVTHVTPTRQMTAPETAKESGAVLRSKICAVSAAVTAHLASTVLGCRSVNRVAIGVVCATAIPATTIFETATAYALSIKDTGRTCRLTDVVSVMPDTAHPMALVLALI